MTRRRDALEVVTAVLLGLVSVATAFGAYQASLWGREASDLASISQQLRDRNLTEFVSAQLQYRDDTNRVLEAFALQVEATEFPDRAELIGLQQDRLVATASPALQASWVAWADSGYAVDTFPIGDPAYNVALYATPQSLQAASFVADGMVDRLTARASQLTGAAVLFAVALFVIGVAGILSSVRALGWLIAGGTALLVAGLWLTFGALLG